jgi:excisionase family DNA binding protein
MNNGTEHQCEIVTARTAVAIQEILTVPEAAELLRVERKTVYSMVAEGRLPGAQHFGIGRGRAIRIHRETLMKWIASGGQKGKP